MIVEAILEINPKAEFSIDDDDLSKIVWHEGTEPIPIADIEAKIKELEADYQSKQYQRDRSLAYPNIEDQLDMQYWDRINGTNNWETMIAEIKNKYPKT